MGVGPSAGSPSGLEAGDAMTTSMSNAEPMRIAGPVMRADRPYCPRCDARLRFARDEYLCLACGYEYVLDARELELLRGGRQPLRPAAAITGMPITVGLLGGGAMAAAALIAIGVVAFVLVRRLRPTSVS